jgi:hypothetical protein
MAAMSESFVDLSYRGLVLGKRIKLTQVRAAAGFLEVSAPMPVGTTIGIATEDGVLLEARVAEVREQVTGSDKVPGMVVVPELDADAARTWWKQRVSVGDETPVPQLDADGRVTVVSRRMSGELAVPELVDDGRNTAVMSALDDEAAAAVLAQAAAEAEPAADAPIVDDGKRTTMMDAVDLAALGLDSAASSGSLRATDDDPEPAGGKKKKKKKR